MKTQTNMNFKDLGVMAPILDTLKSLKIETPTPIQAQSIIHALEGKDILGIAQTGTGKTLAFGIPLLQQMAKIPKQAIILVPTRELAEQVRDSLHPICQTLRIRSALLIGGLSMGNQIRDLRHNPQLIIATPGRCNDMLEQRYLNLEKTGFVVLDEADRMLDMGFAEQIATILKAIPKKRQTLLFSATMPDSISKLTKHYLSEPIKVEVAPSGSAVKSIAQSYFTIHQEQKPLLLQNILHQFDGTSIVFSRTKFGAKRLNVALRRIGIKSCEIHSNRTQAQRRDALMGFKTGRYNVMVATDVAARGIDVPNVAQVINFDLPENLDDYVHRIGRTGRAGLDGSAISFITPKQMSFIRASEHKLKVKMTKRDVPPLKALPALPHFKEEDDRPSQRRPLGHGPKRQGRSEQKPWRSGHQVPHAKKTGPKSIAHRTAAPKRYYES